MVLTHELLAWLLHWLLMWLVGQLRQGQCHQPISHICFHKAWLLEQECSMQSHVYKQMHTSIMARHAATRQMTQGMSSRQMSISAVGIALRSL